MAQSTETKISFWITPMDPLFFRDGKPFRGGEECWGTGTFPPTPSPFYGALRSLYFANHMENFPKAQGDEDPTKSLEIERLMLGQKQGDDFVPLFPIPLDVVQKKDAPEKLSLLELQDMPLGAITSSRFSKILLPPTEEIYTRVEAGFFALSVFQNYLEGQKSYHGQKDSLPFATLREIEPKIGMGRSLASGTVKEGMLYRVGMARLKKNYAFYLEGQGLELPSQGFLRLGGESKSASFKSISPLEIPKPPSIGEVFKVVLVTPGIFEKGWLPSWIHQEEEGFQGEYKGLKLRLLAASLGRSEPIGGFDIKNRLPKVMRKAVPAGSVYYFQLLEGSSEEVFQAFHHQRVSDDRSQEGFGLAYVGKI